MPQKKDISSKLLVYISIIVGLFSAASFIGTYYAGKADDKIAFAKLEQRFESIEKKQEDLTKDMAGLKADIKNSDNSVIIQRISTLEQNQSQYYEETKKLNDRLYDFLRSFNR